MGGPPILPSGRPGRSRGEPRRGQEARTRWPGFPTGRRADQLSRGRLTFSTIRCISSCRGVRRLRNSWSSRCSWFFWRSAVRAVSSASASRLRSSCISAASVLFVTSVAENRLWLSSGGGRRQKDCC